MSGSRVKIKLGDNRLGDEIMKAMDETKEWTEQSLKAAVDKTTRETVKRTKAGAPVRTNQYKSNWGSEVSRKKTRGGYGRIVRNKRRYMLAHLLQWGHGGLHPAPAYPHIPSDAETEALFTKNMEMELKKR